MFHPVAILDRVSNAAAVMNKTVKFAECRNIKGRLASFVGLAINAGKGAVDPAQMNGILKHRLAG